MAWQRGRSQRDRELGAGWPAARLDRLEYDHYTCQIRGPRCTGTASHVDHTDDASSRYDHRRDVLRSACQTCHMGRTARQAHAARPALKRTPPRHPGLL